MVWRKRRRRILQRKSVRRFFDSSICFLVLFRFSTAVLLGVFGYFKWYEVLTNLLTVGLWHWCGAEDLGYAIVSMIPGFNHPPKYYEYHPATRVCGIELPKESYWLSKPRKFKLFKWTITIPSVIGFVCGKDVPGWKFVLLSSSAALLIIVLSFYI